MASLNLPLYVLLAIATPLFLISTKAHTNFFNLLPLCLLVFPLLF